MEISTLIRGTVQESEQAKALLVEAGIQFREIFTGSSYHSPVLITGSSVFSYKGVSSIKEYCDFKKNKLNSENVSVNV